MADPQPPSGGLIPLAPANVGGAQVQTVNARELHAFLGAGHDFTTWIRDRIAAYGFAKGADYVTDLLPSFGEKGSGPTVGRVPAHARHGQGAGDGRAHAARA